MIDTPRRHPLWSSTARTLRAASALLLLSLASLVSPAQADVLWVADFDEGFTPIDIASTSIISDADGSNITHSFVAHSSVEPALGNSGYSLKVNFTTGEGSALVIGFGQEKNLTSMSALSFWIRGASGGEGFKLSLKRTTSPKEPTFRPYLNSFMDGAVTTQWKKVVVPLRALMKDYVVNSSTALMDITAIVFTIDSSSPTQSFYLDDILFHTKVAPVWVDSFNDTNVTSAFGYDRIDISTTGSPTSSYDVTQSSSGPGSLKIDWTFAGSPAFALTALLLNSDTDANNIGEDVSACNVLALRTLAGSGGSGMALRVATKDETGSGTESFHSSSITVSSAWTNQTFALSGFTINNVLDQTKVDFVELWFRKDNSPEINNPAAFTLHIDDVRFMDTVVPTAPSALADDSIAVANGHLFGSNNSITFNADANITDPTIESIRLEHDGMSGGTNWYRALIDTNTATGGHTLSWKTSSLQSGTSYQVRLVAMDIAGNESSVSFSGIDIAPCNINAAADLTAPTLSHTAVSSASALAPIPISISVTDNLRVAGASLFYRAKGASSYSEAPFSLSSLCSASFTGTASIPVSAIGGAGMEYYVTATDGNNTVMFASPTSPQFIGETSDRATIGKSGGTVKLQDFNSADGETALVIAEGALDRDTVITLEQKAGSAVPSGTGLARNTPLAALEIGPSGTTFRRPSVLTLLYSDQDNDGLVEDPDTGAETTFSETDLRLFTHDGFDWKTLGGTVNASLNTVTGNISHLSSFALFPAVSGASSVKPKEKIITPSGSPGVNDALNFGGNPTGARIEIYDVSGRLVKRIEDQTAWNGRDSRGEIVESGVYIYRAEVDGEKVSGTVTVAR